MPFEEVFLQAVVYLGAAVLAILLGKRLGLGAVLGYLLVGALIGPSALHWIGRDGGEIAHFSEFGVVVMLFLIGLELRPAMLWRMRKAIIGLGGLQVASCAAVVGVGCFLLGVAGKPALAIGLILTVSSTAIALQTLKENGLMKTEAGENSFAVLLFQDIAVIPIMALLPLLGVAAEHAAGADGHGDGAAWMAGVPGWGRALITLGAVVLIVVVGRICMRHVFRLIAKTHQREAFTGAALLLVIGVALLMIKVGLSPALGAFVAGVVLAGSEYRHELESDLEPFKGLLLGVFFLSVGAGIDFAFVAAHPLLVVGGALGLLAVKGAILFLLGRFHRMNCGQSLVFSASLAAGGEFAFVLISLAVSSRIFSAETSAALVAIVALSMAATPPLILAARAWVSRCPRGAAENDKPHDVRDEGNPVIICGFGRYGHAVGRLLRARGFGCTVLDNDSDQVELLRNLGVPVFYGDGSRPEMLAIAGAADAKVLVIALKDETAALSILRQAHSHFPHLKVFLRAYSRSEAYAFLNAGEQLVYRETLESSLRMGADILHELGVSRHAAARAARTYFHLDERMVKHMAEHRDREGEGYMNSAREAVRSLDELLRGDLAHAREAAEETLRTKMQIKT